MSPPLVSAEIGFEVTQLSKKDTKLQDQCRCKTRFTECCIAWIEGGLKTVRPLPSCSLKRLWSGCRLSRFLRNFFLLNSKLVRVPIAKLFEKVLRACNCKIQNPNLYKNLPLSHVQLTRKGRSELKGLLAIMYILQCTPIS